MALKGIFSFCAFIGAGTTMLAFSAGCSPEAVSPSTSSTPSTATAGATAGTLGTPLAGRTGAAGMVAAGRAAVVPAAGGGAITPGLAGSPATGAAGAGVAGIGGTAGMAAAGAPAAGAAGMTTEPGGQAGGPAPSGTGPTLPAIAGECPEFRDGNIMVAGHRSIAITAGDSGKNGPLLFYWHGTGGSAGEAMRTLPSGVRSEIVSMGGIIASFNGSSSSGTGRDCSGTSAHNQADFDAADQIAACAAMNHGIDARRIYTTGCSAGGLQSGCMAQLRSSYIAASAPNSGGVVSPQQWQDDHTPAVFTMHGGSSDVVIVTFSQTSATFDMSAKSHGSFVVNCDHGGGHCAAPSDLQTAAWTFMKDHPWGFGTSPWASSIPAGVPDYCKVF